MKSGISKTRTSLFLPAVGLFMLAGVFSDARLVWGQLDVECTLPEGVMAVPDPIITAAQVEADPTEANLMTFVGQARDYYQNASTVQQAYGSCVFRRGGGDWMTE